MKRHILLKALPSFRRSTSKISGKDRENIIQAIEDFMVFVETGDKRVGLGFKKLRKDLYEFRVDLQKRIVVVIEGNICYLAYYGNHDEIERFLRNQ